MGIDLERLKEGEVGGREQEGQSVFGFPPQKSVCVCGL